MSFPQYSVTFEDHAHCKTRNGCVPMQSLAIASSFAAMLFNIQHLLLNNASLNESRKRRCIDASLTRTVSKLKAISSLKKGGFLLIFQSVFFTGSCEGRLLKGTTDHREEMSWGVIRLYTECVFDHIASGSAGILLQIPLSWILACVQTRAVFALGLQNA